jgi:hypothetical protein
MAPYQGSPPPTSTRFRARPLGASLGPAKETANGAMSDLAEDLAALAEDELSEAGALSWRELAAVLPWGDAYEGFTAAGRQVTVERSYLWAEAEGGDILCEVVVYGGPSRYDEGARASRLIRNPGR